MLSKIGRKLVFAVGLTTVSTIGIFAYFNIQLHISSLLSEVERHAYQLSETIKYSIHYDMLLNQRERIDTTIHTIAEQPSIRDVRILNKSGEVIYSSIKQDVGKMVDKQGESCYACHAKDQPLEKLPIKDRTRIFGEDARVFGIINPIYNEESCWTASCHEHAKSQRVLGVLDITISLNDVDRQIEINKLEIAIFAVTAVIFLSIIIIFFVRRWVGKPVGELLKATDQVGMGNFDYTIVKNRNDELGYLGKSFNVMTKKIADTRLQLFQSDKMASLGRIAAGVAHEINNPLTGILTFSSCILKRAEDGSELKKDMEVIVRETLRSRDIVKSLLDFSRQNPPQKKPTDVNDVIEKSITVLEKQFLLRQVQVLRKLKQNLPVAIVDANQIEQVMINLLINAADAIGEGGGRITISTSCVKLSPSGVVAIKKAECPKGHQLMDENIRIDGMPTIKMYARTRNGAGQVHIDPLYGRHNHLLDLDESGQEISQLSCPRCDKSLLLEDQKCPSCHGPLYMLYIPEEGSFIGCVNTKCTWEKWPYVDSKGANEYIEIRVTDTGSGISADNMAKIFDPFFSTKGANGTGLGLSVIWGIVDNHNGTIAVESEMNQGSTFIVRLLQDPSGENKNV